jgi:5-formyltetrahydrofolate cyclo-ligase
VSPAHRTAAAASIARYGLSFVHPTAAPGTIVSGYAAMGDELDPAPLLARLAGLGFLPALPVIVGKGVPLMFRAHMPGDALMPGVWGIGEPSPAQPAVTPAIILVPLLAFDEDGWRLGYGGGYYDRTLRSLRRAAPTLAIGIAFDEQAIDAVPHLDYDERLDWILTPSGPRRF